MDWFFMLWGYALWIFISLVKIFYAEAAQDYALTIVKSCVCHEAHIPKGATLAEKMKAEDYARDRCEEQCGMPEMVCSLDRKSYSTYADYKKQCRADRDGSAPPPTTPVDKPSEGW